MMEKTLSKKYCFNGRIMNVRVDDVELPNGHTAKREICEHVGGVGVLPIDEAGNVYLVRQYRYAYGEIMLEIPAGKIDPNEAPLHCGVRELSEETGLCAKQMHDLGAVYPSPGFLTEVLHLFCATGLTEGQSHPDIDEFVEVVKMPIAELEARIASGELRDAKTIIAVYQARLQGIIGRI